MCAAAQIEFSFKGIVATERWETPFRALVMTIWSWLNNYYQETLMNKDQVKGRVEETKGKVKEVVGKVQKGFGDLKEDIKKDK